MYLKKADIRRLSALRDVLTMKTASFDKFGPTDDGKAPLPTKESEVTDFIRNRTEIWRRSWVFPFLDELLARAVTDREFLESRGWVQVRPGHWRTPQGGNRHCDEAMASKLARSDVTGKVK